MRALHPTKIKVLKLLNENPLTIYRIAKILKIPRENLKWHILSLEKSGLLLRVEENGKRLYKTNPKKVIIKGQVIYIKL